MKLQQLKSFCEIVRTGSATQAAAGLYVAPTAVSMQLSQLEDELGGALFDRTRRPMQLTPLGHYFYPRAQELVASATRLKDDTRGIAAGRLGWLGIGFTRSAMFSILPNAIQHFRERYPEIQLELLPLQSDQQPVDLLSGRIQVGVSRFLGDFDRVEGLDYLQVATDPFVAAVPKTHPLARRKAIEASELLETPYIFYPRVPQGHYAEDVFSLLRNAGASPAITHYADDIYIALGMVASGLGYCLVGNSIQAGNRGDIACVPLKDITEAGKIVAVTKSPATGLLINAFIESLKSSLSMV